MLKLTVAVMAFALAGTASAAGWRSLRLDGSGEASFTESAAAFKERLPPTRRYAFAQALQDIWLKGLTDAAAAAREYTASDYYRQLDGLAYKEVVTLLDPTGDTEQLRRREASGRSERVANRYAGNAPRATYTRSPWPVNSTPVGGGRNAQEQYRGGRGY
jgi:hypothetical protein